MFGHRKCIYCKEIGHKADMIQEKTGSLDWYLEYWYHESCYMKAKNKVKCPCGNGYIDNPDRESLGGKG